MESARDTGRVTLSGKAVLGADMALPAAKRPVAFGLFLPVYRPGADTSTVAGRRAGILGWASCPFRAQDFVATFATSEAGLGMQMLDSAPGAESAIAAYPAGFSATGDQVITKSLEVGGRSWVLRFSPLTPQAPPAWYQQVGVLIGGAILSLLLASLVWLYAERTRERSLAEAKVRASEAMFRSAFDDALVGMCLTGLDGRLIRANAVFAAMIGWDRDTLVGVHYSELSHPDDTSTNLETTRQVLSGELPGFRTEKRFLHADGSEVRAELSASLVRGDHGQPLYFSTQTVNITARRKAERERDTRDLMLAGVIANSQSLVYVKDLQGRYLLANKPFQKSFGVTEEELLGKDDTFLDPELAPVWKVNDLRAQHEEYHVDEWSDGPEGRFYYESVKFPLRDPDGDVYATCGVSLDVTGSRRAATEMEAARDAAVASDRAKSAFLATMSHEIRTPMNAVIGMTGLLLDTELDEEQREFVETVRTSGDALLATINDILDFSRLEGREVELEDAPFELQGCLEEAVSLVAGSTAHVELVVHVDPRCPRLVRGDMHRLRQVLVNLVSNAAKFTQTGDVLVSAALTDPATTSSLLEVSDEVALTFAVRDTGIGIPEDRLDRLFKSFSQVDASTTRVYGGSGLGLAICRAIVEAMGGQITVTSTVGVGSTFAFDLVMNIAPDDALSPTPAGPVDLAARRALLVDDNDTNRRILRLQLEAWGMRCIDVAGGPAALAILADDARFDVAILDLHMPDMDGEELAGRIRAIPGTSQLPLMLLTSLGSRPADGTLFGAFHTKPVRAQVLRSMLGTLLGGPRPPATQPTPADGDSVGRSAGEPLKVLVAEDNPVNQSVMRAMLGRLGHSVFMADNGQEALAEALRTEYDVVLMDVHMPLMDGLAATRAIRAQVPGQRQPRIIALTASSLDEDRYNCTTAGMDGYLLKPVRIQQLASALSSTSVAAP